MDIQIRRAMPEEAAVLTEIAHAAKRHWGYPENWIEHWQGDLTITRDFISNHEVYVAVTDKEIAGCCALVVKDSQAELEHMWIRPQYMGAGYGKALFVHVMQRAATLSAPAAGEVAAALAPLGPTHVALTHTDETARPGAPLELALAAGRPLSYVCARAGAEPADPASLAQQLLP